MKSHCRPGNWGSGFYRVMPEPSEYVIVKHRYSGFMDTDLDLILRSLGIRTIALVGVATNVCVESTARDGYQKGYYVIMLEDCVATMSKAEHEATLTNIRNFFGVVASSQELVEAWQVAGKTVSSSVSGHPKPARDGHLKTGHLR